MPTISSSVNLEALVNRAVEDDTDLSEDARLYVMAAMAGDAAFADLAGYERPPVTVEEEAEAVEPAGAFLTRITVSGFRGIGPTSTLPLAPGPGLTIVAGRNGSGKSSFCEGLEVALTGKSARFAKGSTQWQSAWRNLHQRDAAIEVLLSEEGAGETTVRSTWDPESDLADARTTVQRTGKPREEGLAGLGWEGALLTHRPILTYDELGEILTAKPSLLHDALSTVLGLDAIGEAIARLRDRVASLKEPKQRQSQMRKALRTALDTSDDERAERALKLVRARTADIGEIRALATGTGGTPDAVLQELRSLGAVALPSLEEVVAVTKRLRAAAAKRDLARAPADLALDRRITLIDAALAVHDHDGNMPCPICGEGILDSSVSERLKAELATDREALRALRDAGTEVAQALASARALIPASLPSTGSPLDGEVEERHRAAASAVTEWSAVASGDDPRTIADAMDDRFPSMVEIVDALSQAARTALADREDAWAPLAAQLAEFARLSEAVNETADDLAHFEAAHTWLRNHDAHLRNERLRPIATKAMEIWSMLRQESNVEIADLTLEGSNTSRRVTITSRVDGEEAPGMTVLSQGELHALALALFLPRATTPESPFRFVVLDDPVQAMDPSKVDGLLAVLADLAERRQVVVFSHDDRLANAARHGGIAATILEITREAGSVVSVHESLNPAMRYLSDAHAMARDENLPPDVRRRLLPGILRLAVEAAARERWFGDALRGGMPRTDVENRWNAARTTKSRVSLAVSGDTDGIGSWHTQRPHRKEAMAIVTAGMHQGLAGDPFGAHAAVKQLVNDLKAHAR